MYGITTVPERRDNVFARTLMSLKDAGFPAPRIFLDGANGDTAKSYQDQFGMMVTARYPRMKAYANWLMGIGELFLRDPTADYYAMFQDDFVTYRNLRQYLEACTYPTAGNGNPGKGRLEPGYWNLYTFPENQGSCPMFGKYQGWYHSNQRGWGAVALVFDQRAISDLLTSQKAVYHLFQRTWTPNPKEPDRKFRAIDGAVVQALFNIGYMEYVHNPSLVQHTGTRSAIGNGAQPLAVTFKGENFDALDLLPKS